MKAKEFSMNIPVKVIISPDGNIEFVFDDAEAPELDIAADVETEEEQIMVPPLQQSIELQKAAVGKESEVIDQLIDSDDDCEEEEDLEADEIINHWRSNPPWSQ